jgi:hypothetical protein
MLPWQRHKRSRASPEDHLRRKSGSLAKFTAMRLGNDNEAPRKFILKFLVPPCKFCGEFLDTPIQNHPAFPCA